MLRFVLILLAAMTATHGTAAIATFNVTTPNGVDLTLEIDSPITMNATSALICTGGGPAVFEAKLWMIMDNGQQHGSTPTTVMPAGNHCYRIGAINFVMTGEWQIRVKLADGDRGTFRVPVVE